MQHFTIGEPVYHTVHGRGAVRAVEPEVVLVDFELAGRKRITRDHLAPEPAESRTQSRVYPDLSTLDHPEAFVPPLTVDKKVLVTFLDARLGDDWRIYVRPHLDGDLPSAATLSRRHGAVLWDVDDAADLDQSTLRRPVHSLVAGAAS